MREKRRICKQCVGWAGAKHSLTLYHLKVGLWPSLLLLAVVMGGCGVMNSPSRYERGPSFLKVATQADLATFNEAVVLVESQHYEEAIEKFRLVFDKFATSADHRQRAAETLFWIGFCREKQQRLDEARLIYARVTDEYAETRAAEQACSRLLHIPPPPG